MVIKKKKESYKKTYIVFISIIALLWIGYSLFFYSYYKEALDLVTVGAKNEINILELFYYRGTETVTSLVMYFSLVCAHGFSIQYFRIHAYLESKNKKFNYINISIFIIGVVISMFNILWILHIILTIIALTVNHILYVVSQSKYNYYDGEIIFEKKNIKDKKIAEKILSEEINKYSLKFKKTNFIILDEIILDDNNTYSVELSLEKKEIKS